jgi:hypothetical protein
MPDITDLVELGQAIAMGLISSLTTGWVVAYTFRHRLPTFQLLFASFLLAIGTWAVMSIVAGSMLHVLVNLSTELSSGGLVILGFCLMGMMILAIVLALVWQMRNRGIRRWAMVGALIPWAIVSVLAIGANVVFLTTDVFDQQVPEFFMACVHFAMAIGIIVGACAGGMIHHQTRHLRPVKSEPFDKRSDKYFNKHNR